MSAPPPSHEMEQVFGSYNAEDRQSPNFKTDRPRTLPWRRWIVETMNWSWFTSFAGLLIARWIIDASTIRKSFLKPPECYFSGSFWLSSATIIICMQRFGVPHSGPWLLVAIRVLFWMYAAVTLLSTTIHLVALFERHEVPAIEMNPAWLILVYNTMLVGTIAGAIASGQPAHHALPIIVAGVSFQGFGWISSMLILTWFFGHLMEKGWPSPSMAPGLFMTVGSSGFTIVAIITKASGLPSGYGYLAVHPTATEVLQIVAVWVGVFLWIFALWLFGIAFFVCLANIVRNDGGHWTMPMRFNNTWWAFIFPNAGFVLTTVEIGRELYSNAIEWVSVAMIIVLVVFWLFDIALMGKTVVQSFRNVDIKLL